MNEEQFNQKIDEAKWLQAIVETSVDSIITINNRGLILSANQSTVELFGYTKEELYGNNVSMLMPNPDKDKHDGYLANYLRTGTAKIIGIGREVVAQKKNGVLFACLLSISEVVMDGVHIFTGILHDISDIKAVEEKLRLLNIELESKVSERTDKLTEVVNRLLSTNDSLAEEIDLRKQTESALKRSEAELLKALDKEKELSDLKSKFVTMASHEFKTPLSTILSSSNLIEKYTSEETQKNRARHVEKIKKSVHDLNDILNDFLSLGKMDEGKIKVNVSAFSIAEILRDKVEQMELILKPGQEIRFNTFEDVELKTDEKIIRNILTNLISNAIKYSGEYSLIKVDVVNQKEKVELSVADEGIGIPKKEQHHLFERFYRAHNSLNIQGTGLGLHLVKNYVEKIGGTVSFISEENKGSTFTIKIPKDYHG